MAGTVLPAELARHAGGPGGTILRPPEPGFPGSSPIFDELRNAELDQPASSANAGTPLMIDVDGDAATAECDFVVVDRDEAGHGRIVLLGRYRDRFRRLDDGGWVITDRVGVSMARSDAPPGEREPIPRQVPPRP